MKNTRLERLFVVVGLGLSTACSPMIKTLNLAAIQDRDGTTVVVCDADGAPFGGGDGSTADPFRICTMDQLKRIDDESTTAAYVLMADLDASGETPPLIAKTVDFTGRFDGGNHKIANLAVSSNYGYYLGLFQRLGAGGAVENLVLKDVNLLFYGNSGALVGEMNGAAVRNVTVTGSVLGGYLYGGVIGYAYGGSTVENVKFVGTVAESIYGWAESWSGGIIGRMTNTTARGLRFEGTVTGGNVIGGLVGLVHPRVVGANVIEDSSAEATVTMNQTTSTNKGSGGLVGLMAGDTILRRLAFKGTVTGLTSVGGIAGYQDYGSGAPYAEFTDLSAEATVVGNGSGVGGLVGTMHETNLLRAAFVGTVTNLTVGTNASAGGITGGGCGQIAKQLFSNVVATGEDRVGGITADGCVSEFEDVIAVGAIHSQAELSGGLQGMNWAGSTWKRALALMEIHQSAPAQVACTGAMFNQCYNAVTNQGNYYATAIAAGAPEAYGSGLTAAQMQVAGNFPEFDFTTTWTMPTNVSWHSTPVPVLRWMCGKYGVTCN